MWRCMNAQVHDVAVAVLWCVNCILHLAVHCAYDRLKVTPRT